MRKRMKSVHKIANRGGGMAGACNPNSKKVQVYDINNKLVKEFGSIKEVERKSEKYLGILVPYHRIKSYVKSEELYDGKYYFKMDNYIF